MINLEKTSGLPVQIRDDFSLVFERNLPPIQPQIRDFFSMRNYLKDPGSTYWRKDVYHMYRDMALPEHAEAIHAANLEYDITVIPPGTIGREYVKTVGHYHPYKSGTTVRYPEIYEVLYGKVFWLFQSASEDLERLKEVYIISAERGEKVVVPQGFGHVSINPTEDVLVMANWQPLNNKGLYEPYEIHNGAAYYVMSSEHLKANGKTNQEFEFAPNLTYKQVPPLIQARPRELPQYDLRSALPMYFTVTKNLATADFLTFPEKYADELIPDKLFTKKI